MKEKPNAIVDYVRLLSCHLRGPAAAPTTVTTLVSAGAHYNTGEGREDFWIYGGGFILSAWEE